ncbi:MAG: transglycosylase SLT domain-containing protein [Myxococcota bacterium]
MTRERRLQRQRLLLVAVTICAIGAAWIGPDIEPDRIGQELHDPEAIAAQLLDANASLGEATALRTARAVVRYSAKYQLDPVLVTAVLMVESTARPWAQSPKGAVGLMQVMPHMMEPMALAGNVATIESNIEAGCWILAHNIRRLGEDDGISAYFWGSEIRGVAYLERVREAREALRRRQPS